MKKSLFLLKAWVLLSVAFALTGCLLATDDSGDKDEVPAKYKEFFNYPDGRKNSTGFLEIRNSVASPALLFTDSVLPANYIGTVDSLSTIKVKLPEQKFYTIVAVDKALYEERGTQASQYSDLTFYSNTQPYSMAVTASNTWGGGTWIINNNTTYWVSLRKSDLSGTVYAVAAPNAKRVSVPIQIGQNFDYIPHFYKELKYDGRVIALVESDQLKSADTVATTEAQSTFTTDIAPTTVPSASIKPAILFTNSSDKTVRVYSGQNNQLSNGASQDFALASGSTQMFTNYVDAGSNTNSINFASIAWSNRVPVTQNMVMQINKVYRIVLGGANDSYTTTVTEEDASAYFN
ncbi:hypothetical protein [Leadbettera azotonutricia]|uniref:Putative lipoprotein n=1 Tax=Leadbettera azotonutricia (strain ATCC BAA-888 / DSM 13862 / ZAS-9) TaxID=545695 RepID=F5Y9A1_LEAAZ|nr:hypothetical protein [Leadbettera azotonutricia]AEF80571.1 putative lipoprotein [Leadbettera azotonutricia ZAS-9]